MCGRFTLITPMNELVLRFRAEAPTKEFKPRYNAAPTQELLIIPQDTPHKFSISRWGLIPHWAKDAKIGNKMINAKAETLLEKPSFKNLISGKRCMVIADGFYEWKKSGNTKIPYRISLPNNKPFAFAGLYEDWINEGKTIRTFTIITTAPNSQVKEIHDRMPVILPERNEKDWLTAEPLNAISLLNPFSKKLLVQEVSRKVNNPENDNPSILQSPNLLTSANHII